MTSQRPKRGKILQKHQLCESVLPPQVEKLLKISRKSLELSNAAVQLRLSISIIEIIINYLQAENNKNGVPYFCGTRIGAAVVLESICRVYWQLVIMNYLNADI